MFGLHSSRHGGACHKGGHDHSDRHFMRRMGGRGFGHFAKAAFGDAGAGGFKVSRMLGAADLQLIVLNLLAEKPRHGYEIIKALEEHSSGLYSPSPGVIYPALTYLEEIGHASVATEGAKKLYSITPEGSANLAANREAVDTMLTMLARMGQRASRAGRLFAEDEANEEAPRALRAARDELRKSLREKFAKTPDEAEWRRIADILAKAAQDIRGS